MQIQTHKIYILWRICKHCTFYSRISKFKRKKENKRWNCGSHTSASEKAKRKEKKITWLTVYLHVFFLHLACYSFKFSELIGFDGGGLVAYVSPVAANVFCSFSKMEMTKLVVAKKYEVSWLCIHAILCTLSQRNRPYSIFCLSRNFVTNDIGENGKKFSHFDIHNTYMHSTHSTMFARLTWLITIPFF